ncbi:morn repeat-containing protein [Cystoisospora suis]|uniref:Morn repeat-containing protein n=1 Tax=Cystoisospora suis TaxID=483139 RepID=A0A2C6LBS0_9APIC|nr:morn repeat-containing protein [Cystoisospora suis]
MDGAPKPKDAETSADGPGSTAPTEPGKHSIAFPDGSQYFGECKLVETGGQFVYHGKGIYRKGGYVCHGEWRDGRLKKAFIKFPTGDIFEGQLVEGHFHGWGKYTWCSGEQFYEGSWVRGLMDGPGTLCARIPGARSPGEMPEPASHPPQNFKGFFVQGKFYQTPSCQMSFQDIFVGQYTSQWRAAVLRTLQEMETALLQGMDITAYLGGGGSGSPGAARGAPGNSGTQPNKPPSKGTEGSPGGEPEPRGKPGKKAAARPGAKGSTKAPLPTTSVPTGAETKQRPGATEHTAEKFILGPYPQDSDLTAEILSRLVAGLVGNEAESGQPANCDVRVPLTEQELSSLVTVEPSRILADARVQLGCGSGQLVEVSTRTETAAASVIAFINCNDLCGSADEAFLRVVGLSIPPAHQKKFK